ncbi:MAG TPA: CPBP family intramembrane glutamic endopeptidase [Thermoanaerobaculia bacterium]|nr:CPBP family intramembrane glutamic endopeptidase [Thermoanaerobaculia bacterium]
MEIILAVIVATLLTGALVFANERHRLLATDHFSTPAKKWVAYAWVWFLAFVLTALVAQSTAAGGVDPAAISFWSLFTLHVLLIVFLAGWWILAGSPPVTRFLNLQRENFGESVVLGIVVGVGGWLVTIAIAITIGLILKTAGMLPEDAQPSPVIPWMAALPLWKKAMIVFSAMTVEEAFFRGWLQKRVGLVLSTILFAISHAGYGQPLLLIGVTVVSLVIGATFYRTRNLWPCIIAHGVFDAIQLFVLVPTLLKFTGQAV